MGGVEEQEGEAVVDRDDNGEAEFRGQEERVLSMG